MTSTTLYCECETPVMDVEHDAGCRRCGRPVDFSPEPLELAAELDRMFEERARISDDPPADREIVERAANVIGVELPERRIQEATSAFGSALETLMTTRQMAEWLLERLVGGPAIARSERHHNPRECWCGIDHGLEAQRSSERVFVFALRVVVPADDERDETRIADAIRGALEVGSDDPDVRDLTITVE